MAIQDKILSIYNEIDLFLSRLNAELESSEKFEVGEPLSNEFNEKAATWLKRVQEILIPESSYVEETLYLEECEEGLNNILNDPIKTNDLMTKAYKMLEKVYLPLDNLVLLYSI